MLEREKEDGNEKESGQLDGGVDANVMVCVDGPRWCDG